MPREEIEKELGGIVVEIRKGEAVNSSVIQVEWEVSHIIQKTIKNGCIHYIVILF